MRVDLVQNRSYNKKQVNFGCELCEKTKDILVGEGFERKEVHDILQRVNPEDEVHDLRADMIHGTFQDIMSVGKRDQIFKPGINLKKGMGTDGLERLMELMIESLRDAMREKRLLNMFRYFS